MLRKILSFSAARLKSMASFSSAHFKVVTLAVFWLVFGSTLATRMHALTCCNMDTSYSYLAKSCFPGADLGRGSGLACFHCKCNQVVAFDIPVSNGPLCMIDGSYDGVPGTYGSTNTTTATYWISHNVSPSACQSAAYASERIGTMTGWTQDGQYDVSNCFLVSGLNPYDCP